jgi:hypothetical protein
MNGNMMNYLKKTNSGNVDCIGLVQNFIRLVLKPEILILYQRVSFII